MPEKEREGQGKAKSNTRRQIKGEMCIKRYSKNKNKKRGEIKTERE